MPKSVQQGLIGRRTEWVWKFLCMYEVLDLRFVGQQMTFAASAEKRILQGFFSVFLVESTEIVSQRQYCEVKTPNLPSW